MFPSDVKDAFLQFLQNAFAQSDLHADHDLIWDANPDITKIYIADRGAEHYSGFKPSIILSRGSVRLTENFIGTHHYDNHAALFEGSISAECRASEGLEAEKIAAVTAQLFKYFETLVASPIFEVRDIIIEREVPVRVSSEAELMSVTVSMRFVIEHVWDLSVSGELLKDIIVSSS